jgi:hypothetical protein
VNTTSFQSNAVLPRISVDSIYQQIISDLTDAQNSMSAAYGRSGKLRPNQYTATALLAKVYLYEQKWDSAIAASSRIIGSGNYSLVPNLNGVFLANSNEAIWQLLPVDNGYETPEGNTFIPGDTGIVPKYAISSYLLNAFEIGDQRRYSWVDSNIVLGTSYYYPYKYKLAYDGWPTGAPSEEYMVFRLGEQYLIRAEAEAENGDVFDAASDINLIRNRAGLQNTTASNQSSMLAAIEHERQVELFCEWGNRWFDLKRTGMVSNVMPNVCQAKGGVWSANWVLYPVPLGQIQLDANLTQNVGY